MIENEWTEKIEKLEKQVTELENEVERLEEERRLVEADNKDLNDRIDDIRNQAFDFYRNI